MKRPSQTKRAIFAAPTIIGILSMIGLVIALAGEGWHDVASWMTLVVPVLAVIWAMKARRS